MTFHWNLLKDTAPKKKDAAEDKKKETTDETDKMEVDSDDDVPLNSLVPKKGQHASDEEKKSSGKKFPILVCIKKITGEYA